MTDEKHQPERAKFWRRYTLSAWYGVILCETLIHDIEHLEHIKTALLEIEHPAETTKTPKIKSVN